jgi:predicted PurR-regulated permease PerM
VRPAVEPDRRPRADAPVGGESEMPPRIVAQLGAPSLRGVARLVAIVAATAGALYLLWLTRGVIKILLIAVFTATALGPLVDLAQKSRLPRAWAIIAVYLACALAIAGSSALIAPSVGTQVVRLSHDAEAKLGGLRTDPSVRRYDTRYHITDKLQAQLRALPGQAGKAVGPLRDVTVGAFGFIADLIAVLSIAFLLLLHGDRYSRALISSLPAPSAARWQRLAPQVYRSVSGYVVGNLEISVIAGVSGWIAMTVLGIPFAGPLALAIAFFDLIPMVGATIGAILVALVALLVSPLTAVLWLLFSFLYQQLENYVIQPVVYRRVVQVSALATIVAILVGGTLLGLLGVMLAIPAAAAIQLVVADWRAPR